MGGGEECQFSLSVKFDIFSKSLFLLTFISARSNQNARKVEIHRGRGVLKAKFLETMYDNKPEFPGGMEVQTKKRSMGGVWTFSGTAHLRQAEWTRFTFMLETLPSTVQD